MDYDARIRSLEEQLAELRVRLSQPKPMDTPGVIRFLTPDNTGNNVEILLLAPDGQFFVKGKSTKDPVVIGNALMEFQNIRLKLPDSNLLSMTPKGEA